MLDEINASVARGYVSPYGAGVSFSKLEPAHKVYSSYRPVGYSGRNPLTKVTTIPAAYVTAWRAANISDLTAQAVKQGAITPAQAQQAEAAFHAQASQNNSGSFFGGLFDSITTAFKPLVRASLQVSTLGHADQVIQASQTVVRNPIVQAMAFSALTVYTGGAAASMLGGGLAGTVGGSVVANAAIAKATDRTFNLQNALIQGVTAGAGAAVKSAELVANTAVNGAAQAALTKAISDKAAGRAFNLQNTLIAGAGGLSNPVAFNLTVGDIVTGAKQANDLKTAYNHFEDSKAKAKEQSAAIAQNTAQINAEAARIAAAQAELKALQAAIANAKPAPIVAVQSPAVVAQVVAKPPAAKAGFTTAEKIAAAGVAVGVLRLLTA